MKILSLFFKPNLGVDAFMMILWLVKCFLAPADYSTVLEDCAPNVDSMVVLWMSCTCCFFFLEILVDSWLKEKFVPVVRLYSWGWFADLVVVIWSVSGFGQKERLPSLTKKLTFISLELSFLYWGEMIRNENKNTYIDRILK